MPPVAMDLAAPRSTPMPRLRHLVESPARQPHPGRWLASGEPPRRVVGPAARSNRSGGMMSQSKPDAARFPLCCDHGIPRDGTRWCGWCDDIHEGYGDDCRIPPDEPMWLCPHGIGKDV